MPKTAGNARVNAVMSVAPPAANAKAKTSRSASIATRPTTRSLRRTSEDASLSKRLLSRNGTAWTSRCSLWCEKWLYLILSCNSSYFNTNLLWFIKLNVKEARRQKVIAQGGRPEEDLINAWGQTPQEIVEIAAVALEKVARRKGNNR